MGTFPSWNDSLTVSKIHGNLPIMQPHGRVGALISQYSREDGQINNPGGSILHSKSSRFTGSCRNIRTYSTSDFSVGVCIPFDFAHTEISYSTLWPSDNLAIIPYRPRSWIRLQMHFSNCEQISPFLIPQLLNFNALNLHTVIEQKKLEKIGIY